MPYLVMNMKRSPINVLVMIGFIFGFINLRILICLIPEFLELLNLEKSFLSSLIKR